MQIRLSPGAEFRITEAVLVESLLMVALNYYDRYNNSAVYRNDTKRQLTFIFIVLFQDYKRPWSHCMTEVRIY